MGFSGGASVNADVRDEGWIPGSERSPGGGKGNPPPYSCLGNPVDRGAWWAKVHGIAKESDMTERLKQQYLTG